MLLEIHIKNFAIIENLDLNLRSGMTVITGETGAGKSIVFDALDVALGDRADSKLIRHGEKKCEINIVFDIKNIPEAKAYLEEHDLEEQNECIIRRTFTKEGRSRNYINGRPVNLQQLRILGGLLAHIHGQHQHQALVKRDEQRQLIDDYAQNKKLLVKVKQHYKAWQSIIKDIQEISENSQDQTAKIELLQYQVNELEQLQLVKGEVQQAHKEQKQLANADDNLHIYGQALELLQNNEQTCALDLLNKAQSILQPLNAETKEIIELINSANIHLDEAATELASKLENIEIDPERLAKVEERLSLLHGFARKHQVKPEELLEHLTVLQARLDQLKNTGEHLDNLQRQADEHLEEYTKVAEQLRKVRNKHIKQLNNLITSSMQQLGMSGGKFAITLEELEQPTIHGLDQIEFKVTANPGQPLQPLAKVASGGELSRISLAIHVITAQKEATPTLVFDEVDVGIGGSTAEIVGQLLKQLGENAQVLCITHLPQVAAQGDHHMKIGKFTESETTTSQVQFLNKQQRIEEIARMVGGVKITQQTLAHAEEMLGL